MYMSAIMAFLHHLAAFTLVAALAVEVALFKPPLTVTQARRIQGADRIFGIAAAVVLIVGLGRVFSFEKGSAYYFHNAFFHAKLTAFVLAGLISIYPTKYFLSWSTSLKNNVVPDMPAAKVKAVRMCMMLELTLIVAILLCAPFMARGFGLFG